MCRFAENLNRWNVISVFFSTETIDEKAQLAELWSRLATENFDEEANLAEAVCQDPNTPIEFFCGLSLVYGELGFYAEAEQVTHQAVGFSESHWRPRHALAAPSCIRAGSRGPGYIRVLSGSFRNPCCPGTN